MADSCFAQCSQLKHGAILQDPQYTVRVQKSPMSLSNSPFCMVGGGTYLLALLRGQCTEVSSAPDVTGASWLTSSLPVLLTDAAACTHARLSHAHKA